jgi:hypothetical protein
MASLLWRLPVVRQLDIVTGNARRSLQCSLCCGPVLMLLGAAFMLSALEDSRSLLIAEYNVAVEGWVAGGAAAFAAAGPFEVQADAILQLPLRNVREPACKTMRTARTWGCARLVGRRCATQPPHSPRHPLHAPVPSTPPLQGPDSPAVERGPGIANYSQLVQYAARSTAQAPLALRTWVGWQASTASHPCTDAMTRDACTQACGVGLLTTPGGVEPAHGRGEGGGAAARAWTCTRYFVLEGACFVLTPGSWQAVEGGCATLSADARAGLAAARPGSASHSIARYSYAVRAPPASAQSPGNATLTFSSLPVTVRSAADPWVVAQRATGGAMWFGLTQAIKQAAGRYLLFTGALMFAGPLLVLCVCAKVCAGAVKAAAAGAPGVAAAAGGSSGSATAEHKLWPSGPGLRVGGNAGARGVSRLVAGGSSRPGGAGALDGATSPRAGVPRAAAGAPGSEAGDSELTSTAASRAGDGGDATATAAGAEGTDASWHAPPDGGKVRGGYASVPTDACDE